MIKAIETKWRGYRFRSRLEARWAVFFERIGAEWTYEPQGFEREGFEEETLRYLPDFRVKIGKSSYWVEVKGDKSWLKDNFEKIEALHDWGGVLPGFHDCGNANNIEDGLLLLGDIPEPRFGVLFLPILGHRKGINLYWRALSPQNGMVTLDEIAAYHLGINFTEEILSGGNECADFAAKIAETPRAFPEVYHALLAARSARFEHGEVPA